MFLRDSRSVKAAVFYVLFGTLCLYLHATGLLFVMACGGAVWLFLLTQGASGRQALLKWTAFNALVLLLGVPYYLRAFTASKSGIISYMPPAGIHQIVYCASLIVSGIVTPYPWPAFLLAAAVFVTLAVSLSFHRPSNRASVTLIGVPCLFRCAGGGAQPRSPDIVTADSRLGSRATLLDCRKPTPGGWTRPFCCPA